jgi:hypothetical protein
MFHLTMATNIRQSATDRAELGRQTADALLNAIEAELPNDLDILTVHAHRIRQCNSSGNLWVASDLHNSFGEAFDGSGRFWTCGSKLCSDCLAKTSRRNRKMLSAIIEAQRMMVGEHYHFLTLTMPNNGLPLLEARQIMNYAWTLFRKKEWFKETFSGGCKSEEFTLTKRGYHYHMHCIVRGRFVIYSSLRHFWTEALRVAFERCGKDLSIATSDSMAIANIQRIGSISEAIKEVAKYITKASSWRRLKPSDLLDVARIERWPRMFEFFGSFRNLTGVAVPEDDDRPIDKTILDTKCLSDGESVRGWRSQCRSIGVAKYLVYLARQIIEQRQFRMEQLKFHYKAATFHRLKSIRPPEILETIESVRDLEVRRDGQAFSPQH